MSILYKLFRQDPNTREGIIATTSGLGILANILIATTKVIIGTLASSIAIVSEGVNNAADVLTSVLALIGSKLAMKHPDENHPFGYGRVEYLASLVIASAIMLTGWEMLKTSINLIFHPEELNISYLSIGVVVGAAIIKYVLGVYTIKMGEKADSSSLIGVGLDCRNDAYASAITLVSSAAFIFFHLSIDAYAGIIISFLILKAGFEVMKDTVSDLLGRSGEEELAGKIYKMVRGTEGVLSAVDLILHNYGPDAWHGSCNIEIDHNKTVGEVYQIIHELQLRIMHEENVTMVFGIYAVDYDSEKSRELRIKIAEFMKGKEEVDSYHAVYINEETKEIFVDFIVSYKLNDWDGLRKEFEEYMASLYPEYRVELTIETEFI